MAKKKAEGTSMISWLFKLFGMKAEPKTLVCMRQANTWCWPEHLGKKTEGVCEKCDAPIYFEKQNKDFRKICQVCGME